MSKRIISIALMCLLLVCMIPAAYAQDEVPTPVDISDYEEVAVAPGISLFAKFSVTASGLAPGKYATGSAEYTIKQNVDKLSVTFTWSPTTQKAQIGFLNPSKTFYKVEKTGGSYTGTINTVHVPSGTYKVAILNPSSNTKNITGVASCEWTK